MFDSDEYLWSESWKSKDPSEWTMQDCAAYEFQEMCRQHDEQLMEDIGYVSTPD